MSPLTIVYFGTPEFSAYILSEFLKVSAYNPPSAGSTRLTTGSPDKVPLLRHEASEASPTSGLRASGDGISVKAVVTRADRPVGRKYTSQSSPVARVGQAFKIPVLKPEKLDEHFIEANLNILSCDLFVVVSYGKIIPKKLLEMPKLGAINLHGSILPKYRGATPIQQAILNGDSKTGLSIILMDEKIDHGPILATKEIDISCDETYETLSKKMMREAPGMLIQTIEGFAAGKITPRLQNHAIADVCNLIKKESGYVDVKNLPPKDKLDRMIRAYHPWPGVWTLFSRPVAKAPARQQSSIGQAKIVKFLPGGLVQMEGKRAVLLEEFLRGYPDFPIKTFG